MVEQQAAHRRKRIDIAHHQHEAALGPIVLERRADQSERRTHQLKHLARQHADAHAGLHHPAHCVETRHMDAQAQRLAGLACGEMSAGVDRTRGMQADMIAVQRFGEGDTGAPRQRMIVAHHEHQRVVPIVRDVQVVRVGVAGTDAEIDEAVVDGFDHAAARPLFEVELDALVLQLERAQILG